MAETHSIISVGPRKVCVIGWPVDHSRSPMIHNTWLKRHGLEGEYTKIEFSRPLAREIVLGTILRFGPWEHVTLTHEWPALPASQTLTWRGLSSPRMPSSSI